MALSLTEAAKLSNDVLLTGVIEQVTKDSTMLQLLPFITITGNGLTYNRQNAASTVSFYSVGDTWAESTPTFTQVTSTLRILGGDADIDNFLRRTRSNINDLDAEIIALKASAWRQTWDNTFITGNESSDAEQFNGIDKLTVVGQSLSSGTDGAALTLEKLDELIDRVRNGSCDALIMSRRSRRSINKLARNAGTFLETERDAFGKFIQYYNGIPIVLNDYISDAQTVGDSDDCSVIYAAGLGGEGLNGLAAADSIIEVEDIGSLETKDARRFRIKGYVGLALFNELRVAKLSGVRAA